MALLCDVIWAPSECSTTYDVIEQLRLENYLIGYHSVNGVFHENVDHEKTLTSGGRFDV